MTDFFRTYDLVIVGSGAGSISSALVARRAGKSVLVIEKTSHLGGSTALSGGVMWIPNNAVMKRAGYEDTPEAAKTYLDACLGEPTRGSSMVRRHAYLAEGVKAIDFIEDLGMKFIYTPGYSDYYSVEHPGGLESGRSIIAEPFDMRALGPWQYRVRRQWHMPPMRMDEIPSLLLGGRTWKSKKSYLSVGRRILRNRLGSDFVGNGASLYRRFLEIAIREGVELWIDSPATGFVEDGGKVTGVTALHGNREVKVGARAGVLLDSVGFSHNTEMREKFQPRPVSNTWTHSNPGDTGEMLAAVMAMGAGTEALDHSVWVATTALPDGRLEQIPADLQKPHTIMVDSQGHRYVNEAADYVKVGRAMLERHKVVPAVPSWVILESRARDKYLWAGQRRGKPPREWLSSGYMVQAQTLDELANLCSMDSGQLKATIGRFRYSGGAVRADRHRDPGGWRTRHGQHRRCGSRPLAPLDRCQFHGSRPFHPADDPAHGIGRRDQPNHFAVGTASGRRLRSLWLRQGGDGGSDPLRSARICAERNLYQRGRGGGHRIAHERPVREDPALWDVFRREIPLGEAVTPEAVAKACLWLASPGASITGTIIEVDNGNHLRRMPQPNDWPGSA
jgi:3-oxosteroid 1-dehydrogenase